MVNVDKSADLDIIDNNIYIGQLVAFPLVQSWNVISGYIYVLDARKCLLATNENSNIITNVYFLIKQFRMTIN